MNRAVWLEAELQRDLARPRVLDDVVQRLLGGAIERHLDHWRQRPWHPLRPGDDLEPASAFGRFGELAQEVGQRQLGERPRAQLHQQRSHLGQRAARQPPQLRQPLLRLDRIDRPELGTTSAISAVENSV